MPKEVVMRVAMKDTEKQPDRLIVPDKNKMDDIWE